MVFVLAWGGPGKSVAEISPRICAPDPGLSQSAVDRRGLQRFVAARFAVSRHRKIMRHIISFVATSREMTQLEKMQGCIFSSVSSLSYLLQSLSRRPFSFLVCRGTFRWRDNSFRLSRPSFGCLDVDEAAAKEFALSQRVSVSVPGSGWTAAFGVLSRPQPRLRQSNRSRSGLPRPRQLREGCDRTEGTS